MLVKGRSKRRSRKFKHAGAFSEQQLRYGLFFAFTALIALVILEALHMTIFGKFNDEVFIALYGLIGTITGTLISHKAKGV